MGFKAVYIFLFMCLTLSAAPQLNCNGGCSRISVVGVGTQTFINDTASDQDYASVYTIPANTITTNKLYRLSVLMESVTGTSSATVTLYCKLGVTKVITSTATNITDGTTRSMVLQMNFIGGAIPSASSNVHSSYFNSLAGLATGNTVNQPVALATNGDLAVTVGITYSGTWSTESMELQAWILEELN